MVSSQSLLLTIRERAPSTNFMRGWVGPRAGLGIRAKRKISCPYWESNHDSLTIQPIAQPLYQKYKLLDYNAHINLIIYSYKSINMNIAQIKEQNTAVSANPST
jgi:hypothetical protein